MSTTPTDRQVRLFQKALALARDGHATGWHRADNTTRTTYRRKLRGIEIEWTHDSKKIGDVVERDSILRVRVPDAGTVFEARFDGYRADAAVIPAEIVQDDRGGWEDTLLKA